MNSFKLKIDYRSVNDFCAAWVFFKYLICLALGYFLNFFGLRNSGTNEVIFYTVLVFAIFLSISHNPLKKRQDIVKAIIYIFIMGMVVIYSNIVSPNAIRIDISGVDYLELFVYYLVIVLIYASVDDFGKLMHVIGGFARVLSPVLVVFFCLEYIRAGYSFSGYDMVQGYQASLCALVLFFNIRNNRNNYDIVMFGVMTALAFLGGSRGAALVIMVFICLNVIFSVISVQNKQRRFMLLLLIVTGSILVYLYYYDFIAWVIDVLDNYGIRSRTLEAFLGSTETKESNLARIMLWGKCIQAWNNMPLFGYGILGDRILLNGSYPHNMVIEIITQHGFFVGIGLIVSVIGSAIYQCINSTKKEILILLMAFTFTHLMLSGSYLKEDQVFILIGVLTNSSCKQFLKKENT